MLRRFAILPFVSLLLAFAAGRSAAQDGGTVRGASVPPTLTSSTQLVVVDVSVLGSDDAPVLGLKREDFVVLEDGVPQQAINFEAHTRAISSSLKPLPPLPSGVFTNYAPVAEGAPVNVLLIDTLNTPIVAQSYLRSQVREYLETAAPGTRLAIFALSQNLQMLQGFTTDTELLKAALRDGRSAKQAMPLQDASVKTARDFSNQYVNEPDQGIQEVIAMLQDSATLGQAYQTETRIRYSLDGLGLLARYLSGIPGRKNLLWFSGSFPIMLLPDPSQRSPFMTSARFGDEFKKVSVAMESARVAIYPVDARGIQSNPEFMGESEGLKGQSFHDPKKAVQDIQRFDESQVDEHSTMNVMAQETGGRAFFGTNDLKHAVDAAMSEGANFYTITYRPPSGAVRQPGFHHIEVRLEKPGYKLSYRRGYQVGEGTPRRRLTGSPDLERTRDKVSPPTPPAVRLAMAHGVPGSTEIIIESGISPVAEPTTGSVLTTNLASTGLKGPFQTYSVNTVCRSSALALNPEADGKGSLHVAVTSLLYRSDGVLANSTSKIISGRISLPSQQDKLLRVHQELSVPTKGEYSLRIILRDLNNDRVGALELPISRVSGLTPVERSASTASPDGE